VQQCSGMQKPKPFREPPQYPVTSVDHALTLMEMVRDFGRVRISVAAELLGVSVSTAHRLMAMLVYRGYAEQDASRRYVPGPAMGLTPAGLSWTAELRHRARPHLEQLSRKVGETANLVVLSGDAVRFLLSVEPAGNLPERSATNESAMHEHLGGIGDRGGVVLPAHKVSGGKAMLAHMNEQRVRTILSRATQNKDVQKPAARVASLLNELSVIRARGFATNFEDTESGVNAVGVAILDGAGEVIAGLTVSLPPERFSEVLDAGLVGTLQQTKTALEHDLADLTGDD